MCEKAAGLACWRQRGHLNGEVAQSKVSEPNGDGRVFRMVESWPHRESLSPSRVSRVLQRTQPGDVGCQNSFKNSKDIDAWHQSPCREASWLEVLEVAQEGGKREMALEGSQFNVSKTERFNKGIHTVGQPCAERLKTQVR